MPDLVVAPAHRWVPEHELTNGWMAAEVGAAVGMAPDAAQCDVLDAIYAESAPGKPAAFEVAIVAPRQNLKSSVLQIAVLTDLFVMGDELIVWTAHLVDTAEKAFEGLVSLIDSNKEFSRECKPPRYANGDQAIELKSGAKIEFKARSRKGGRGLSGDKVILDEGLFLEPSMIGALYPVLATRPGCQVRIGSSAGVATSASLRSMRDRGRKHDPRIAWFEWGAPRRECEQYGCGHVPGTAGCALDDRELWHLANPALGRRIPLEVMADLRKSMPAEEFAREFLSWWEDPADEMSGCFPADMWPDRAVPVGQSVIVGQPAFVVDVTPDRQRASIGVAGLNADGRMHVEVIANKPGTAWVVDDLVGFCERAGVSKVTVDSASPAAAFGPALVDAGLEVETLSLQGLGQACGSLADLVTNDQLRHIGQWELLAALQSAAVRPVGDGAWAWTRRSSLSDISPLVAVTIAAWVALSTVPAPAPPRGYSVEDLEELAGDDEEERDRPTGVAALAE